MKEPSNDPKERVIAMVDKFNELRTTLVDGLLEVPVTPEWKLWVIDILTENRLLPFGRWISDCPKSMYNYLRKDPWYPEKYRTVTFKEMLETMADPLEHPELIDEFFNYIKEHRIIGTVIDW